MKNGDIALHFSVCPSGGYALVNTKMNKVWGKEERSPRGRLPRPLLQNQRFKLTIILESTCFNIEINDRQFMTLQHRMSFTQIGLISYFGEATIDNLEVQKPYNLPAPLLPCNDQPSGLNEPNSSSDLVLYNLSCPKLPHLQNIKSGLRPGMLIIINGIPKENRFDISLFQGPNPYDCPNSDAAFHMEVYIQEKLIIRNSNQGNIWRNQERQTDHFPFLNNINFRLVIRIESNRYLVTVNEQHLFDFYHRVLPLSSIDHLVVHGGIEVKSITIIDSPL